MHPASSVLNDLPAGMPRLRRPGMVAGIAISLLLHGVLLFGYRLHLPGSPARVPAAAPMTVWLLAPAPPPAPRARPAAETPTAPRPHARPLATARPAPQVAAPVAPSPQAITVAPADPFHPEPGPKAFDMDAARKTARKVANEPDPARANLPVAQLDKKPLYPESHESPLARDIASGKRPDCRTSGAGAGLLAPLIWLTDKKDSGCKW